MNMQALMKQAQNLQKDMMKTKEEIDKKEFTGESALVKVVVLGTKEVKKIEINKDSDLSSDDLEMLEDMILVAINDAMKKVDDETEQKMGKFSSMLPGGF